jgi:hypothetical protein
MGGGVHYSPPVSFILAQYADFQLLFQELNLRLPMLG